MANPQMIDINTLETAALLMKFWPVIVGAILGLVWLVRLEAKVMYLKENTDLRIKIINKELGQHKSDSKNEVQQIFTKLTELGIIIAKIDGKLKYLEPEKKND